jgi:hypothetical protein
VTGTKGCKPATCQALASSAENTDVHQGAVDARLNAHHRIVGSPTAVEDTPRSASDVVARELRSLVDRPSETKKIVDCNINNAPVYPVRIVDRLEPDNLCATDAAHQSVGVCGTTSVMRLEQDPISLV